MFDLLHWFRDGRQGDMSMEEARARVPLYAIGALSAMINALFF